MVAIPLIHGVSATETADFRLSLPTNLEPYVVDSGISKGSLKSGVGATPFTTGPGLDRGAILWNGTLYRVMGTKLVSVSSIGEIVEIGDVEGDGPVSMDYGFGRLRVASNLKLWDYDGTTFSQVTDTDLGPVYKMLWMDGYYVTTDGTNIVVTDLADPFSVNPLKYGSAEADPDQIVSLFKVRGELYVLGSNTVEVFSNTGGVSSTGTAGFPFTPSTGATIPVGCVGVAAVAAFLQTFAFVGGGRNEGIGVWVANGGQAQKISTREIDDYLMREPNKDAIELETRVSEDENRLYVHLHDRTLVYLSNASQKVGEPVWYVVRSGLGMDKAYRIRHPIYAYGKWIVGDHETNALGILDYDIEPANDNPMAFMSYTFDGETFSGEKAISVGKRGARGLRVQWRPHVRFSNYMGLRFRGVNALRHFGEDVGWQFECGLIYNQANGGILHSAELVGLPGRVSAAWAACEASLEALAS